MRNKITISIIIGLMCFVLFYVMSIQIRTIEKTDLTSIRTMRETELKNELSNWKTKYEEIMLRYEDILLKIKDYKETMETDKKADDLINQEIAHANMLIGKTDVQGEGVVITLNNTEDIEIDDIDVLNIINELKMAGAEAISINEKRIVAMTDIRRVGFHIMVNTEKIAGPYVIKAIGDPKYLESALTIKDGYIDRLKKSGLEVLVERPEIVNIPKYDWKIQFKYAT